MRKQIFLLRFIYHSLLSTAIAKKISKDTFKSIQEPVKDLDKVLDQLSLVKFIFFTFDNSSVPSLCFTDSPWTRDDVDSTLEKKSIQTLRQMNETQFKKVAD